MCRPPVRNVQYATVAPIGFGGFSGTGQYSIQYQLDLSKRQASGNLNITTFGAGAFSANVPLSISPFSGSTVIVESGIVPNPANALDTYRLEYDVGRNALDTRFQYDVDGAGPIQPSNGAGSVPAAD